MLARAEDDLDRVSEQIAELAGQMAGPGAPRGPEVVQQVLDRLAADVPDDATILGFGRGALAALTAFVTDRQLVTVHHDPVEVIPMPEIDRGLAVAYCDSPGPLEPALLPTFIAVSLTPAQRLDAAARRLVLREYNRHMVHDLMVHEAMPGHYLQLQHSRRFAGAAGPRSAPAVVGIVRRGMGGVRRAHHGRAGLPGRRGSPRRPHAAAQDAAAHHHQRHPGRAGPRARHDRGRGDGPDDRPRAPGRGRGRGKWRRAQLTSAQLSTYYVGYTEVSDLADSLRAAEPGLADRDLHDRMLAHGSPPARPPAAHPDRPVTALFASLTGTIGHNLRLARLSWNPPSTACHALSDHSFRSCLMYKSFSRTGRGS